MKNMLLLLVCTLVAACGTGIHEVAVAAKVNATATERNIADYTKVVNDLTDNLVQMYDTQLDLLAKRELRKINLLTDEAERLAKTEELWTNQNTARATFRAKVELYKAKTLGAQNFKLALQTSAAVSRYIGTVDESLREINGLLDQLGIAVETGEVPTFKGSK